MPSVKLANTKELATARKPKSGDVVVGNSANPNYEWQVIDFGGGPINIGNSGTLAVEGVATLRSGQTCTVVVMYRVAENGVCYKRVSGVDGPSALGEQEEDVSEHSQSRGRGIVGALS